MSDSVVGEPLSRELQDLVIGAARILNKGITTRSESDSLTRLTKLLHGAENRREDVAELARRHNETVSAYEAELSEVKAQFLELEEAHKVIVANLRGERDQLRAALVEATSELRAGNTCLAEGNEALAQGGAALRECQDQRKQYRAAAVGAAAKEAIALGELTQARKELAKLREDYAHAKAAAEAAERERDELQDELVEANAELDRLRA